MDLAKFNSKKLTERALFASILYGFFWVGYVLWKWSEIWAMPPNNFGDFLGGSFGPLVLFWIVVSYLLQSKELSAQIEELKTSVKAQSNLAETTQAQLQLDIDRRRREEQEREKAILPDFIFPIDPGGSSSSTQIQPSLLIENIGADIVHVSASVHGKNTDTTERNQVVTRWERNGKYQVHWKINQYKNLASTEYYSIRFEYTTMDKMIWQENWAIPFDPKRANGGLGLGKAEFRGRSKLGPERGGLA